MIKIKLHREFNGIIKNCTISKTPSNKYYISILIDTENIKLPKVENKVGVDVGLKEFAICYNGERVDNLKWLRKSEKRLVKLQKAYRERKKVVITDTRLD